MIFLVEYDRESEYLVQLVAFNMTQREEAEDRRIALERELLGKNVSHEVVLLEATDEKSLRTTHRRYFDRLSDFATYKSAIK